MPHFPVLAKLSQILERKVEKVREEERGQRQDLHVLATSYSGQLKAKTPSMIRESDFHHVGDKVVFLFYILLNLIFTKILNKKFVICKKNNFCLFLRHFASLFLLYCIYGRETRLRYFACCILNQFYLYNKLSNLKGLA